AAAAVLAAALARRLFPALPLLPAAVAALTALDWRLAWAAASGMETGLFVALTLALLRMGAAGDTPWPWLGFIGGLAALTRPEGGLLLVAALATRLWQAEDRSAAVKGAVGAIAIAVAVTAPVALYHLAVLGSPLPATFFAKHAFYREPFSLALPARFLPALATFLLSGAFLPLAPWALGLAADTARRFRLLLMRDPAHLLPLGWLAGLPMLYLLWLPYLYHHGRYLFPILPLATLYGAAGLLTLGARLPFKLLPKATIALTGLTAVALWGNGAVVLCWDVWVIQGQQVRTARWIAAETPADAVVATHDIGAMSYFSGRRLVDMAGLITPALTATPRDQERITAVLERERVGYVALLPDWYPWFPGAAPAREVYRATEAALERIGVREFRVYQWNAP
ncbi:MAG: hypothetical protein NTZ05_00130, partial [Chloroflexi bacterium]|nr:hypothetical protein [Chloroflexota bacterium]